MSASEKVGAIRDKVISASENLAGKLGIDNSTPLKLMKQCKEIAFEVRLFHTLSNPVIYFSDCRILWVRSLRKKTASSSSKRRVLGLESQRTSRIILRKKSE